MPKSYHKRNSFSLSNYYNKTLNQDFGAWQLWAAGHNGYNQLGREGQQGDSSSPVQVFQKSELLWKMFSGERYHMAGIKPDNTLWTWGHNSYNMVGQDSQIARRTSPIQVFPEYNWIDVAQGNDWNATSICATAIRSDGTLWTWGTNNHGSLGVNSNFAEEKYSSPVQVGSDTDWAFTYQHEGYGDDYSGSFQYAGKTDGTLWGWGRNGHGQLGRGNGTPMSSPVQVFGGSGWTNKIARYYEGFSAIKSDGSLWTCGYNTHGEIGDLSTTPRNSPVQVGSETNWSKITTGRHTVHAIKNDGSLWGWGHNNWGQIGVNDNANRSSPIQIPGSWIDVAGGGYCFYGIKTGGTLWAWGHGSRGGNHSNLGNNATNNVSSPVQIGALSSWTNVWACDTFAWARKNDGTIWGWGRNNGRVMGTTNVSPPGSIQPPNKAYEEYMNYSSPIQIMSSGSVWTKIMLAPDRVYMINNQNKLFGMGMDEQYRVVDFGDRDSPIQIPGTWKFVNVTSSQGFAVKTDGTLWHWGYGGWGQGGNRYNVDNASFIQVGSDADWSDVTSNYHGVYARKTDGRLYSWGHNAHGHLGLNETGSKSSPVQIPGTWKSVATTYGSEGWQSREGNTYSVMAIKNDDSLWGWGHNSHGEVRGDWTRKTSSPIQYTSPANKTWQAFGANYWGNMYGVSDDNQLWSFGGNNSHGQLGTNNRVEYSSPTQIEGTDWQQVDGGGHHAFALKTNDSFWSWGYNNHGQLGHNNTQHYSSPTQIPGSIRNFSTNRDHTLYVRTDSNMYSMGLNNHGQLGNSTLTPYSSPIQIGSNQWRQCNAGFNHSGAVRNDGTLWAWGRNDWGQLGQSNVIHYSSPVQIGSQTNWSTIHCGYLQTFAIKTDGTLWAWGMNRDGQLGTDNITSYSSPVQIPGNTWNSVRIMEMYENDNNDRGQFGIVMVTASKSNGTIWTWGKGYNHQLGNSIITNYSSPVQVPGNWRIVSDTNGNYSNTDFASRIPFATSRYKTFLADSSGGTMNYLGIHPNDSYVPTTGTTPNIGVDVSSPIQIMSSGKWIEAQAGRYRASVALRDDGTIWTWGINNHGQTASGDRLPRSSPVQIPGNNYISASLGSYGSLRAIKSDGTWWGFGYDGYGALGWGRNITTSSPVQAAGNNFTIFPNEYSANRMNGQHVFYSAKEKR